MTVAAPVHHELTRMLDAVDRATGPVHLATVVDVAGSAYRRPGARMLMGDGERIGSISGGCLERDLARSAAWLTADGPRVVSFDTRDTAAGATPRYNLGCQGVIHVLVEALTPEAPGPLPTLRAVHETGCARVLATAYHATGTTRIPVGTRLDADELRTRHAAMATLIERVETTGAAVCVELMQDTGTARLLLERIDPPPALIVFGAGDDARPLVALAGPLGWRVTVVDRRAERLTAERFPGVTRMVADPDTATRRLPLDPHTAVVLMTHDFDEDAALLPGLLAGPAPYVGLLGPKARTAKLMRRLHEEARLPDGARLERLHTPVGLDLGGETPGEIALAVLAEIVARRHGRPGGLLRDRAEPIHAPAAHEIIDARVGVDAARGA